MKPAMRIGRFLWKTGDGKVISTASGPDGIAARVIDVTGRVVRLQTGYVYHYAFAMMIGVALITVYFMFQGGGLAQMNMTSIPMLSIVTFLPLFGVFWMMFLQATTKSGKRNARWIAFYVTAWHVPAVALHLLGTVRSLITKVPARRGSRLVWARQIQDGR